MNEEKIVGIYKDIAAARRILDNARTRLVNGLGEDNDITDALHYIVREIDNELEAIANLPAE